MFANPLTERLAQFVRDIGIDVRANELPDKTFLPGLEVRDGVLLIDEARLTYPGDILHEAGHIAVAEPEARNASSLAPNDGEEMATLAWSFAALRHLGLAPEVVFHPHDYKGGSQALIDAFANISAGTAIGVPMLQYFGMTVEPKFAAERGVEPFPHMLRWLR